MKHLETLRQAAHNIPADAAWLTIAKIPDHHNLASPMFLQTTQASAKDLLHMLLSGIEQLCILNPDIELFNGLSAAIVDAVHAHAERRTRQ